MRVVGGWLVASVAVCSGLVVRRSSELRMEAVARACHELRGPLAAARLGLELGVRVGELSPAQLRALDLELGRASLALDDLAAVGLRARDGRVRGEVDIADLLADSVEAWRAPAAARGMALALEWSGAPARVWGERLRLAQATGNLIANAIEHGGGEISVRGSLASAERPWVRIEIVDAGPGLPAPVADLARRPRGGRGTRGRGLAIAVTIARDHGGRLTAAPSQRGARLVLELPAVA
ncbi:MAG: sensor histidine kinase [Solirubrobacteraceae bacterium]